MRDSSNKCCASSVFISAHSSLARLRFLLIPILLSSLLAALASTTPQAQTAHATPSGATGKQGEQTPFKANHRPDLRSESAWFQMKHLGTHRPAANAHAVALAKANALPPSRFGKATQAATSPKRTQTATASANAQPVPNSGAWTPLGPAPEALPNCCLGSNNYSGRITSVAVNPQNSNDIWIGSADGGVWNSTSGGASWVPMTDTQTITQQSLSIGSIAIDPNNPNVIYVGTGEANFNVDGFWGAGILKSVDHGQTWTLYGTLTQNSMAQFIGLSIGKIIVDPTNSNTLLLSVVLNSSALSTDQGSGLPNGVSANNAGIWLSNDGGQTWTQVLGKPMFNYLESATDVIFDPTNHNVVYAGFGQIDSTSSTCPCLWKSTRNGSLGSWAPVTSPSLPVNGVSLDRVSLSISQDGTRFYAVLVSPKHDASGTIVSGKSDLYKGSVFISDHTAATWSTVTMAPSIVNDEGEEQWWYEGVVAVDPTNSLIAYLGGVDLYQTTDGGSVWGYAPGFASGVHTDQHALSFVSATSSQYILGNDGGVWEGGPPNGPMNLNGANGSGLNITQLYGASVGLTGPNAQIYAGAQDNDILQYPVGSTGESQWNELQPSPTNADGGQVAVDYTNNTVVYTEQVYGEMYQSTDGGNSWALIGGGTDPTKNHGLNACNNTASSTCDKTNWIMPFVLSPTNHNELFAGTDKLYRSTNDGQNWTAIGGLDALDSNYPISAIAVGPHSDSVIYVGTNDGDVFASTDGGSTFTNTQIRQTVYTAGGMITGLAIDPLNMNVIYATFANFTACPGQPTTACGAHILRSLDGGATWKDLDSHAQLPNTPFESVVIDPLNNNTIFVGTDVGIFDTSDGGNTWYKVYGLPAVAVEQMFTDSNGTQLYVATHGRGLWRVPLVSGTVYAAQSGVTSSTCTGKDYAYADASLNGARAWTYTSVGSNCPNPEGLLLANGVLYFADDTTGTGTADVLVALDALSGRVIWQTSIPYFADTLAYLNGTLFAGGDLLYALNANTGATIWSAQLAKPTKRTPAPTAGDILSSSSVVYTTGSDGYLYAFDPSTGAKLWTSSSQETGEALSNGILYVFTQNAYLAALNASTHALLWQVQYQIAGQLWLPWAMTIANGVLYIGSSPNDIYGRLGSDNAMVAITATNGALLWTYYEGLGQDPLEIPAVANGLVYDGGNQMYAWQATTGAVVWTNSSLGPSAQVVIGSPVIGNDVLYISTAGYGLYALNPMTGTVLWTEPTYGVSTVGVNLLIGGTSS